MIFSSDFEIYLQLPDSRVSEFSISSATSYVDEIHIEISLFSPDEFREMSVFLSKFQSRQISYFNINYKEGYFTNCILHSITEETDIPSMTNGWIPTPKFSLVLQTNSKVEFNVKETPVLRNLEQKEKLSEAEKAILNFLKD